MKMSINTHVKSNNDNNHTIISIKYTTSVDDIMFYSFENYRQFVSLANPI